MAATEQTRSEPDPYWVRLHEATGCLSDDLHTGGGWWSDRFIALRVGEVAKARTRWTVCCGCVDQEGYPSPCCYEDGYEDGCEMRECQCRWYLSFKGSAKLPTMMARLWKQPRVPVTWVGTQRVTFPDGATTVVLRAGRPDGTWFRVQALFVDVAEQAVTVEHWEAVGEDQTACLLGVNGGKLVAAIMGFGRTGEIECATFEDLDWRLSETIDGIRASELTEARQ